LKVIIIRFTFGVAAFDEQKSLMEKVLYPKKPQEAAKSIFKAECGKISNETSALISILQKKGYDTFIFENANIARIAKKELNAKTKVLKPAEVEFFRARVKQIAVETCFSKDEKKLDLWNHNVSIELAKLRVKSVTENRDLVISQAIQTLDDLDKTANLFVGRLREWYSIHFPELDRLVEKHETYARLIINIGYKDNFTVEVLESESIPKIKAENICNVAKNSMGADISADDLREIQALSRNILEMYGLRKNIDVYINKTMEEVAPNTKAVVGALLGARLIAIAGSLQNLAMKPASTIQVLGAEKALFRSLKTGSRPPKHGLIFQHTLLHDAKRWQRGKIARVIAGKAAIAARTDAFGGKYIGKELKSDIEKRLKEIREKYKEPPPPREKMSVIERRVRKVKKPKRRDQRRREKKRRKNRHARQG
jgi:nucleolar protein 56